MSRISKLIINGLASGSAGAGDHFGIVAEDIVSVSIGGTRQPLTKSNADNLLVSGADDFRIREISSNSIRRPERGGGE